LEDVLLSPLLLRGQGVIY